MMAHEDGCFGGNVIHAVFHSVGGRRMISFVYSPLSGDPAAVKNVAAEQNGDTDQQKYKRVHAIPPL